MIRVDLPRFGRMQAWREAARLLASNRIAASEVAWTNAESPAELFGADPLPPPGDQPVAATKDFLALASTVASHSEPGRWALLYAALIRLQDDRRFLTNPADAMLDKLSKMAKSVRRDIHKMHAFVRFHELVPESPRRSFGAWFEPDHPILESATPFFARRFADMEWLIATPEGTARFDGALHFHAPTGRPDLPEDASHDLWQTYFANIFNPARIKTDAMKSEMPLKYWKNLPETGLIGQMLADAPRRVQAMADAGASTAPGFAAKVTARVRKVPDMSVPQDLEAASAQVSRCTRCELHQCATQAVWGRGSANAALMIVGEAPGDQEDLHGRPFVGPAGQLLKATMDDVGLDQDRVWLTNAVKHFKFTPRGKRRIHQTPDAGEITRCRWWIDLERQFIQPRLTVAMGATAAFSLTGNRKPLTPRRGQIEQALDGGPVLLTWHPSLILRLDEERSRKAREEFTADLTKAAGLLAA